MHLCSQVISVNSWQHSVQHYLSVLLLQRMHHTSIFKHHNTQAILESTVTNRINELRQVVYAY
jgi:hypothetical protein